MIPSKPETVAQMKQLVSGNGSCRELSCLEREILSHNPPQGETLPRPCIAPGCRFAHNRQTAAAEYADLLAAEAELQQDTSKEGKRRFSEWRMRHAYKGAVHHFNVQPGSYGRPLFRHHMKYQILDSLHLAVLGLPKIPWKYGIKNNASDDALESISQQLKEWKHPLDMRRKDDGRVREQKWFTGEKWLSFCAGKNGSPGRPIAIASLVLIIADDLQKRGVKMGAAERGEDVEVQDPPQAAQQPTANRGRGGRAGGRGRSRSSFADRVQGACRAIACADASSSAEAIQQDSPTAEQHQPSAFEACANQTSLQVIRTVYGSRAHTLINALLAFDAYFAWFYPYKQSVPYLCETELREARALENCRRAIDMQEMFERVSLYNHHSFLPHGAVFKVSRDILEVGDVSAHDLSPLELQNAETKRVFESGGSRHLRLSARGITHKKDGEGGYKRIVTKGYGSTAASSVLFKLLATQKLRQGDGGIAIPASRRGERLFGANAIGRSSLVKLEIHGEDDKEYDVAKDTCLDAFVRLLEARISSDM